MNSVAAEIHVKGLVQGVGYRYFCYTTARALGLAGWAKNMPDGSVALLVEGDRSVIESFVEELKIGPSHASVSDVTVQWKPFTGKHHTFQIAR